jgi:ATP/maltotriose-dependent transcriptional regulator MalT
MSRLSQQTDKIDHERDMNSSERPLSHLLDEAQWHFIRKQFRMSPRELEVARMVCEGFGNEEIAAKLKIRSTTVKTHLRNVYRRVNVQRKLDMLLKFLSGRNMSLHQSKTIESTSFSNVQSGPNSGISTETT